MNKNTESPVIKVRTVMHGFALLAALLAWSVPASAQSYTGWPLAGTHATQPCSSCHKNNVYKGTPRDCFTCHQADFANAKAPVDHVASHFPNSCDSCHKFSDTTWTVATFSHTTFPLVGVHATQACATCHVANNFTTVPTTCYGCHQKDFQNAANATPINHTGFGTACDSCHKNSDSTWLVASAFNHQMATFQLAGAHTTATCAQCHVNGACKSLQATQTPCVTCHQKDYNGATTPVNHITSNFPTTCENCHKFTDATWMQATFAHTTFPLVGVHATQPCAKCHVNNNYSTIPTTCIGCHQSDFTGASSPVPHTGFPTTCDTCHKNTDTNWNQKSAFNHSAYFPLAGAHTSAPCAQCHTNGNYLTVPTAPCAACHQKDYNGATTPVNHITSNFPTTCDSCHKFSDATWMQATFSHTTFPLVGVHATQACATCHNPPYAPSANNYTTVPTTCFGCHGKDFTGATTPVNHSGFATTCDTCHKNTDATWLLASAFNHASYFPLAGAHTTAPCAQCHTNGNYLTVPTSPCSSCHLSDYNNAKTPVNHIAAGFPTTCDTCHKFSDTNWSLGKFNHTYFPLTSNHNVACNQCHTTANTYTVYNCIGCHTASQTNSKHSGVKGYVWASVSCYSCHPNGKAG